MAPDAPETNPLDAVEDQLKLIIHDLHLINVAIHKYQGPETANALQSYIKTLIRHFLALAKSSTPTSLLPSIPPEIITYVEDGRNPDIYTREFVELAKRGNQYLKGKAEAFASFRDVLAEEIRVSLPELREGVETVVEGTGGRDVGTG
ncbi:MAG: RNA polymerase II mediator complex subunit [Pycnora praestabilis]|nr:MAG: RNA polymerase II mediator complex subunit [Pycnora praestabilis]